MKGIEEICCPCGKQSELRMSENRFFCSQEDCFHSSVSGSFPVCAGTPRLISDHYCDTAFERESDGSEVIVKRNRRYSWLNAVSKIHSSNDNGDGFIKALSINQSISTDKLRPKVLVIGGGTKGFGEPRFSELGIDSIRIDVYDSELVDYICDAHYVPFKTESFDGVWIQAVLEHVVDPLRVVDEITRVLRPGGVVYAETPFMQQVHEGAYDFQRYTVTGHRFLFRRYAAIEIGAIGSVDVALSWSIRYFSWALFRSRFLARLIGTTAQFLLALSRPFLAKKSIYDGGSAVYFLGHKTEGIAVKHSEVINLYKGQF